MRMTLQGGLVGSDEMFDSFELISADAELKLPSYLN